jgi:hypothetical protein
MARLYYRRCKSKAGSGCEVGMEGVREVDREAGITLKQTEAKMGVKGERSKLEAIGCGQNQNQTRINWKNKQTLRVLWGSPLVSHWFFNPVLYPMAFTPVSQGSRVLNPWERK